MADERLVEVIADACRDPVLVIQPDRRILEVNSAAVAAYGYTRDELRALTLEHLVDPRATQPPLDIFELGRAEPPAPLVSTHRRKDGSTFPVELLPRMVRVGGQEVLVVAVHDVAERSQARAALQDHEAMFRAVLENSHEGITLTDPQGLITFRSASHQRINGYSDEDRLGRSGFEVVHPEDLPDVRRWWGEMLARAGGTASARYRIRHKDGTYRWVDSTAQNLLHHPRVRRVLITTRDVTEQVHIEEAHRASQRLLADAGRIARVGGWAIDLHGNTAAWTEETYRIHELPTGGRPDVDHALSYYHPEDRPRVAELVRRAAVDGEPFDFEARFIAARGTQRWVRAVGSLVSRDGRPVGIQGMIQDITERKEAALERERLQAELVQAQKLESIGRLAGGIAHDFNNLLSVILGQAELVLARLEPDHPARPDVAEIEEAAARAAHLTRQLLGVARRQVVTPRVVDLGATVEGLLPLVRRMVGERITLSFTPPPGPAAVRIDHGQVDQLVTNLAINARDAIDGTGEVRVEVVPVDVSSGPLPDRAPGEYVRLAITDTGRGIEPAVRARLFEPFFTTKPPGQGTGLGLATVYGIVRQNGGFVEVSSTPGQGSTFALYLPRHRGSPVEAQPTPPRPAHGGSETVLLVEDEAANRDVTRRMLESLGYRVLATGSPEEAVSVARSYPHDIHLLFTDVVMPGMDGPALADEVARARPGIHRLFTSGFTGDTMGQGGFLDEGVTFLPKPVSMAELARKVRQALDGG